MTDQEKDTTARQYEGQYHPHHSDWRDDEQNFVDIFMQEWPALTVLCVGLSIAAASAVGIIAVEWLVRLVVGAS